MRLYYFDPSGKKSHLTDKATTRRQLTQVWDGPFRYVDHQPLYARDVHADSSWGFSTVFMAVALSMIVGMLGGPLLMLLLGFLAFVGSLFEMSADEKATSAFNRSKP